MYRWLTILVVMVLGALIVSAPPAAHSQDAEPHRIDVRVADGVGEFYDTVTGETFVPRGVNLLNVVSTPEGYRDHVFATDVYDPEKMRAAFRDLHGAGYNTVRIFFDHCHTGPHCITRPTTPGVNPDYIANMADLMRIAGEEGVYLLLTSNDIPDGGGYGFTANQESSAQIAGYRNAHYLTTSGTEAAAAYWRDILTELTALDAPTEALLGWQLLNEQWFFGDQPPFSLTGGVVQTSTGMYDLGEPDAKRQMAVDGILHYIDATTTVIRELDPGTLVTMGFFAPQYPNDTGIGGTWYVETAPLIERAPLDFFDFHAYTDWDLGVVDIAENFGMPISQEKPVIMGEVSGGKHITLSAASQLAVETQWFADSCEAGFDGWLHWLYYENPQALGGDAWALLDDDGVLFEGLAPVNQPDPCNPIPPPVTNVAYGAEVRVSNQLPNEPGTLAVDGSDRHFCSGADAPQWIDVLFDTPQTITSAGGSILQYPSGDSRQQALALLADGTQIVLGEWEGYTIDGTVVQFELPAPLADVVGVRFLTLASAGWPCWHELEVIADSTVSGAACVVTAANDVNLRAEPSTDADIPATLSAGTGRFVVAQTVDDDGFTWWQVDTGAWVRGDVVTTAGDCTAVPQGSADAGPPESESADGTIPVTFVVTAPEGTVGPLVIAGDFGPDYPQWDPAGMQMEALGTGSWLVTLQLTPGQRVEYKFTRGSWETVEKGAACEELANRVTIVADEAAPRVTDEVAQWRDVGGCP